MDMDSRRPPRHGYFLPQDLVADIFLRLPTAAPLFRFRSVSKSCNLLLSDPKFLHRFLRFESRRHCSEDEEEDDGSQQIMFTHRRRDELLAYTLLPKTPPPPYGDGNNLLQFLHVPIDVDGMVQSWQEFGRADVVGCCGGVFCIAVNLPASASLVYLWNPNSTSDEAELLLCHYRPQLCYYGETREPIGFGFDSSTLDYRVVRVYRSGYVFPLIEVYSSRNDSLRNEFSGEYNLEGILTNDVVRANNSTYEKTYWYSINVVGVDKKGNNGNFILFDRNVIVSFDFRSEKFSRQVFPTGLIETVRDDGEFIGMATTTLEDSLVAVVRGSGGNFEIWGLLSFRNVESWTKLFNYETSRVLGSVDLGLSFVGFSGKGEYIFVKGNGELFSVDFDKRGIRDFEPMMRLPKDYGHRVTIYSYLPSRVSIAELASRG